MKAIILVGGFATRLYPLTQNTPKALLPINDTPILDYIMKKLERVKEIDEVVIVGNSFFKNNFETWLKEKDFSFPVRIINDNGKDNASKPGALGGLRYSLNHMEDVDDDIFLLAGDNYFDFELAPFVDYYRKHNNDCLLGGYFDDKVYLGKNFGVVELDENEKVLGMEEKPAEPKSNIGLYAFYLFKNGIKDKLEKYFEEGNNPDALGFFISWLKDRQDMYCYVTKENCFDIGTIDMYKKVCEYDRQKLMISKQNWDCDYYITFSSCNEFSYLCGQKKDEIEIIFRTICEMRDVKLIESKILGGEVHIVASISPKLSVAQFIEEFKDKSSALLCEKYLTSSAKFWNDEYNVCTINKYKKM